MLFAESDAPLLKAWIIKRLANTSDADADVLADYVLALLRHDGDIESIRKVFEEEIPDFLREDSAAFTDDVFQAVKYQSYLPGAPPAPPVVRQEPAQPTQAPHVPLGPAAEQQPLYPPTFPDIYHTPYAETPAAFSSPALRNGSRKRSYRDLDAPEPQVLTWNGFDGSSYQQLGESQPYKQARRGSSFTGRGGFIDSYPSRGRGAYGSYPPSGSPGAGFAHGPSSYSPNQPFQPPQPPIDANTILENIQRLQELGAQMGIQMPQAGHLPQPIYSGPAISRQAQRRRAPCRDYELKGFCSRGSKCQFDHGTGVVYAPSFAPPPTGLSSTAAPLAGEEYDPNNATMTLPVENTGQLIKPQDLAAFRMPPMHRRDFKKPRRGKGGRSAFSAEGPMTDRTNTKIVVENIPEANFSDVEIRNFFTQFGTIGEVILQPQKHSPKRVAIIKFDSWASANAAWKSPKVVFDNRFVKVYWYKDDAQLGQETRNANGTTNGHSNDHNVATDPEFDAEEFKRKQEEAQKVYLEKTQKLEEIERQRLELEEKRKELLARREDEKRKLQAKLAERGIKEESISPILTKSTLDEPKQPSQAEALRAKLAALEQEANSLGIDPDATLDESPYGPPRGRGRGRRPYRGRGSFPPRAARGGYGYRGRGGGGAADVHAAYAAYSLDNRPKIILLTGVDFTEPSKDEALRQYLFGIGEFTAISIDSAATHVTFKDRKTAEQFMFGVSANKSIPGVDGTVELSWASSIPKTVASESELPMAGSLEEEQGPKAVVEVDESSGFEPDLRDQGDMDYEAGEWDMS